jgi:microcystin-dependent protein
MSNYTKATNFTAKDGLPTGNSGKIVKGAEIDTELTAVASAISSKADLNSPALTGTPTAPTASVNTNTTQLATTAFVQTQIATALTGVIVMWSGSIATIPTGWVLCNGSNSTPDLRNRFIVGAGSTYSVDATGGSATSTLTSNELPAHTHSLSASGTTSGQSAGHTHTFSGTTSGQSATHSHSASVSDPGHTHASPKNAAPNGGGAGICMAGAASGNSPGYDTLSNTTGISVTNGNADADHTHTYSGTTSGVSGDHTHTVTVTGTSGSTGSGASFTNLPPYYALAFIMKT